MKYRRDWVIGDIHGCRKSLEALIKSISPSHDDRIVFLGDYIDRGPDSAGVIDFCLDLKESVDCVFLRGNHESMLLSKIENGRLDLMSHLARLEGLDLLDGGNIRPHHLDFFESTQFILNLDGNIMVHGGIDFSSDQPLEPHEDMLWIREMDIPEDFSKRIIHGHTPTALPLIRDAVKSKAQDIPLDGGCAFHGKYYGLGYLCALELNRFEWIAQEFIG